MQKTTNSLIYSIRSCQFTAPKDEKYSVKTFLICSASFVFRLAFFQRAQEMDFISPLFLHAPFFSLDKPWSTTDEHREFVSIRKLCRQQQAFTTESEVSTLASIRFKSTRHLADNKPKQFSTILLPLQCL